MIEKGMMHGCIVMMQDDMPAASKSRGPQPRPLAMNLLPELHKYSVVHVSIHSSVQVLMVNHPSIIKKMTIITLF